MKNYYEILRVSEDASQEKIRKAYRKLVKKFSPAETEEEKALLDEIYEAYDVLGNVSNRKAYDKEMFEDAEDFKYEDDEAKEEQPVSENEQEEAKPIEEEIEEPELDEEEIKEPKLKVSPNAKNFFQRNKGKIAVGALVVGGFLVGWLIGNSNQPKEKPQSEIVDTIDDENLEETPVVEEKLLTAENFDETVDTILADNQSKGLDIDPTFIRSALFITNIDYLDQEDIKKLYGNTDLNMIEEIQNMYNYTSAVGTHNNNVGLGQKEGSYISLSKLAFDPEDKAMLYELDVEFVDLVNDLNANEMTDESFQSSFKYIKDFYVGNGNLTLNGNNYSLYSLTSGGGLLAEQYWPMFSVIYADSEFVTSENQIDIKSLSAGVDGHDAIVNGSRWLGSIINHEALNCLDEPTTEIEEDKTLTKTQ